MVLEELVSILGFRVEGTGAARRYLSTLANIAKRAAAVAAGLIAIGAAAVAASFKLVRSVTDPLDGLIKMARRVGENVEVLQEWQHAAEESGTTLQALGRSIEQVNSRLEMATRGQGRAMQVIEKYGLALADANGEAIRGTEFMLQLADVFQEITEAEQADIAKQLGITPTVVNLLQAGSEGIAQMREEARLYGLVLSEQALKDVEEFNDQSDLMGKVFDVIKSKLALGLVPALKEAVTNVLLWVRANQDLIDQKVANAVEFLKGSWIGLTRIMTLVFDTVGAIATGIDNLTGVSKSGSVAFSVMGGILLLAFSKPLAVAIALLLAMEDIQAFREGEDSWTGSIVQGLKDAKTQADETFERLAELFTSPIESGALKEFVNNAKIEFMILTGVSQQTIDSIISGFLSIPNAITSGFQTAIDFVKNKFNELSDFFSSFEFSIPGVEELTGFSFFTSDFLGSGSGANTGVGAEDVTNNQNNIDVNNRTEINTQIDVTLPEGANALNRLPGQIANEVEGVNQNNNQSINSAAEAIGAD